MTTEGLLFAALSVTISLTGDSTFGRLLLAPKALAGVAVGTLTVVAVAAGFAWAELYYGSGWPPFEVIALLLPIAAQPVLAAWIALSVWRD